jgi:hypothetical protein
MTDIHADEIGYLVGLQGILPAIGCLEITGKTVDNGIAFDGDIAVSNCSILSPILGMRFEVVIMPGTKLTKKPGAWFDVYVK